jgi:hypothetical protein
MGEPGAHKRNLQGFFNGLLGGLGMLLAVLAFVLKQVTWYKAKIEDFKLKALLDTNHTIREEINAIKQLKDNSGPQPA